MKRSFADVQNLTLSDCALSDKQGETSFQHVVTNPRYSGFRKRRYDRPNEQIQEIHIKTDLLDEIVPEGCNVHFIKIDVEGAEFQVLQGAVQTIRRSQPVIIFEHGMGAADHYETTPESVYDWLRDECQLRIFLMSEFIETDGNQSLSRETFCEHFYRCRHYYFMAAP